MRRWIAGLMAVILLSLSLPALAEMPEVRSAPLVYAKSARNGMVRVYLSSMGSPTALDITVDGNYIADGAQDISLTTGSTVRAAFDTSTGHITLTASGRSYNMGRELALRRRETSGTNGLRIKQAKKSGNLYPGDLHLVAQKNGEGYKLYPIVHVYMENYLCGVVPYEMGNSAQLEALKAQAVAARTYTLNKMNVRASNLYDVVDTTNDQVYYGNSDSTARCTEAVMATKGIVLMNGSKLTSTWYTASNGGQTESAQNCWGSTGYDYLVVKDDPFDLQNSASSVKSATVYGQFDASGQNASLRSLLTGKVQSALGSGATITAITAVTPHTPKYASPSRLYTKMDFTLQVRVNGSSRSHTVTCDIFSELESTLGLSINASKNELWSVMTSGDDFIIQSRRYGHGVGMSQRGAMRMGALGYTYDQILGFYYENSQRMQHTFTHTILSGVTNETLEYEEPPADITDPDAVYATVTLPGVNDTVALRAGKSSDAALLTYLGNGAIVTPLAKGSTWTKVRFGSLVGYLRTNVLSFTGEVPASSDDAVTTVKQWATVSCNGTLNLRDGAKLSANVITTIPDGEILVVFGTKNGFAHVQYGAHVGYASLDFLRLSNTYPGQHTESTGSAVTIDSVNMRAKPSTSADVLMVIPAGAAVTVSSNDGSWSAVTVYGVQGYVQTRFLSFGGEGADSPDLPDEPDEPVNGEEAVVSITGDYTQVYEQPSASSTVLTLMPRGSSVLVTRRGDAWCTVSISGMTGYMRTSELRFSDSGEAEITGYARVTTPSGSLNLRQHPQAGSGIITTIPRGSRVAVLAVQDGWTRVTYGSCTGWVMSQFLTMENGDQPTPPDNVLGYAAVDTPSGSLNLRETPDAYARVLTTIPRKTRIGVLMRQNGWTKTSYAGYTGWVMDRFLAFEGDEPSAPVTPSTPSDLPATGYATVTGGGALNMREKPSAGARVLLQIPEGAQVEVLGLLGAWTYVRYNGSVGYVMSKYLSEDEPASGLTAMVNTPSGGLNLRNAASADGKVIALIPRHTRVQVTYRGPEWTQVIYDRMTGWVMSKYLLFDGETEPEEDTPADAWVSTSGGWLNFREEPSSAARVIGQLSHGTKVTRLMNQGAWSKIRHNGQTGWVQSKFLSDVPVSVDPVVRYVNTPSGPLNLREEPAADGRGLASIPRGEAVMLLSSEGTWSRVVWQDIEGWVMSKFLSANPPASPEPENPEPSPVYDSTLQEADDLPGFVDTDVANAFLYEWCSEDAPVAAVLHGGDEVIVTQTGRTWCRVRFNEYEGYCLTNTLFISEAILEVKK